MRTDKDNNTPHDPSLQGSDWVHLSGTREGGTVRSFQQGNREHGRIIMMCETSAICPWCDEPVGADAIQYGSERMHPKCHEELGMELHHTEVLAIINSKKNPPKIPVRRLPEAR